jgi:hypothetical protein
MTIRTRPAQHHCFQAKNKRRESCSRSPAGLKGPQLLFLLYKREKCNLSTPNGNWDSSQIKNDRDSNHSRFLGIYGLESTEYSAPLS